MENLQLKVIEHKAMHALIDVETANLVAVYINKKEVAERVALCVNSCAGLPTNEIKEILKEIDREMIS